MIRYEKNSLYVIFCDGFVRLGIYIGYFPEFIGGAGYILLFQPQIHTLLYIGVDHGKGGHANYHPPESEQSAEYHHRTQHPKARKARGVARDPRENEITVDLHYDHDRYDKYQTFDGAHHQDQEGRGDHADKRSEYGYDIRDADKDADKLPVRHLKDKHYQIAYEAQHYRVDKTRADKAGKDPVDAF